MAPLLQDPTSEPAPAQAPASGLAIDYSADVALGISQADAARVKEEIASKLERDQQAFAELQTRILVSIQEAENQAAREVLNRTMSVTYP